MSRHHLATVCRTVAPRLGRGGPPSPSRHHPDGSRGGQATPPRPGADRGRRPAPHRRLATPLVAALALSLLLSTTLPARSSTRAALAQDAPTATAAPTPPAKPATSEVATALPPPDLPASNAQGYDFKLKATLKGDLARVAKQAPVYELIRAAPSRDDAQALAQRLKIGGDVADQGNGAFAAKGNGELLVSPDLTHYVTPITPGQGKLPTDDAAVAFAREWLRQTGLLPADLGAGQVVSRVEQTKRVVVVFAPTEPAPLLAAYPSVNVSLGPQGSILEATIRWATIKRGDLYQLRPAEEAWRQVERGQAYLDAQLDPKAIPPGASVTGTAEYADVSLAYTTAGPPGGQQFLEPVFVFAGRLKPQGQGTSYPIKAYVSALALSGAPVG